MIIDNKGRYIYYLILDGTVVYIGQTTNVTQRIFTHKSDKGKIYDSFKLLSVSSDMGLSESEFIEIVKHKPVLNKSLPNLSFAVYEQRVKQISDCIKDVGLDAGDFYNKDKPDMSIDLNGKVYRLWAKKGFESQFERLLCSIDNGLPDNSEVLYRPVFTQSPCLPASKLEELDKMTKTKLQQGLDDNKLNEPNPKGKQ